MNGSLWEDFTNFWILKVWEDSLLSKHVGSKLLHIYVCIPRLLCKWRFFFSEIKFQEQEIHENGEHTDVNPITMETLHRSSTIQSVPVCFFCFVFFNIHKSGKQPKMSDLERFYVIGKLGSRIGKSISWEIRCPVSWPLWKRHFVRRNNILEYFSFKYFLQLH